jgi:hypothetical protein
MGSCFGGVDDMVEVSRCYVLGVALDCYNGRRRNDL